MPGTVSGITAPDDVQTRLCFYGSPIEQQEAVMDAKERLIRGLELFAGCSRAELDWVLKHSDEIRLRPGTTIASRGAIPRECIVIVDGVVTADRDDAVALLGRGATIGGEELTRDRRHEATIETVGDVCVLVFEARVFRSFEDGAPTVARKLSSTAEATVAAPVRYGRGRLAVAS